jgi:KUP system potassium uptake protein
VGISVVVLVLLFVTQSFNAALVGSTLAPTVIIWLLLNAGVGIYNLVVNGSEIFSSLNPWQILQFFERNGREGWLMLGGVVLCITGAEAMYADLGHFTRRSVSVSAEVQQLADRADRLHVYTCNVPHSSVLLMQPTSTCLKHQGRDLLCFLHCLLQLGFIAFVYPTLMITYWGQGAHLLNHPADAQKVFWRALPRHMFWPMFISAVLAAIVASQALITGAFSIMRQVR